ncbi:altronate dehydratase family protein [Micromonospora sp. 4G57]|uniref:Altronate dehydratase family protein n=1 Tax=Micromonospora sicca TaxID=2202420 RepID=A0ABU5JCE6_9ACTN|nr:MULTISPECIES: altronate dehydratase family protein [unclassified Micromonospora]MDZ5441662.1 altronate dehydratase family protein [Micromonospora sp. 4G57]MDZ5490223.1 altronate dehydratase family protein [Micromonospora sp. 4G53]
MSLVVLNHDDDVAVATSAMPAGASVPAGGAGPVVLRDDIPPGHKVALRDLPADAVVRKYGQVIGRTLAPVRAGEHVHVHNLGMPQDAAVRDGGGSAKPPPQVPAGLRRTFHGYRRPDGRVATRNYVGVLTTVNCSATVARKVARVTEDDAEGVDGVDGVVALTHGTGCGMADRGEGWELLRRTLAGYAGHPNIGGLVVIGLGCEVNAVAGFMAELGVAEHLPVSAYTIQDMGGTAAAVGHGVELVRAMVRELAGTERREVGVEELVLGLQCGGSDGWSGLTANPALGVASDLLVAAGATSVLGETPEVYGAEHLLADRATSADVAGALMERIRWWEEYTRRQGTTLDANPSPGNKEGGITTILEKSLGAVAKAGHSPLAAVRHYAEQIPRPGLVFMDTPGYDPVSVTGMVAGGANLICFTTGRGSVFGSRPVPTVKLASNGELARRMAGDIDLDCSPVVERNLPVEEMGRRVYDLLLDVASGRRTASEEMGLGGEEIVPWQLGAVL